MPSHMRLGPDERPALPGRWICVGFSSTNSELRLPALWSGVNFRRPGGAHRPDLGQEAVPMQKVPQLDRECADQPRLTRIQSGAVKRHAQRAHGVRSRLLKLDRAQRPIQVGEETIKWHMKNLFAKLDAGTRKQVVSRARILGLLEHVD